MRVGKWIVLAAISAVVGCEHREKPMPFRPMPLLDFELGIYDAQEPWRAPPNSFVELENAYVKRGQLLKRAGYTLFGTLDIEVDDETIGNGGIDDSGTLANYPVSHPSWIDDSDTDSYHILVTDGTAIARGWKDPYIDVDGPNGYVVNIYEPIITTLSSGQTHYSDTLFNSINSPAYPITFYDDGGATQTITIDYVSGPQGGPDAPDQPASGDIDSGGVNLWSPSSASYDVTFSATTTGTVTVTAYTAVGYLNLNTGSYFMDYYSGNWTASGTVVMDYRYKPEYPVLGIKGFFSRSGNEYLIANDTKRIYVYNSTTERFDDLLGADEWGADNDDFFQYAPYEDVCYINNNDDVPKVYDPSGGTVTDVDTDYIDGSGDYPIDYASFFLRHKNRAIYFKTSESSTLYSQRARYTPVDDLEYSGASSTVDYSYLYSDAPTDDQIISAFTIADDIVVPFNRSMWVLRYNGDPNAPYEWQRIPSIDGAVARMGFISFGEYVVFRGTDALMVTDGVSTQRFDFDIPGFSLDWNQEAKQYSFGIFVPHDRQGLMTYAKQGDSLPENVIAITLDEDSNTKSFSIFKFTDPFHCFGRWRGVGTVLWDDVGTPWDDIDYAWDDLRGIAGAALILAGDRSGNIYQYPVGYTDNGTEFTGYAKTAKLNPVPGQRSHLGYIEIMAEAVEGGSINVLAYADHDPNPYMNATVDLSPNSAYDEKVIRRVAVNKIANFHTLKIEMPGTHPVAIDQIAPFFKPAGPMRERLVSE